MNNSHWRTVTHPGANPARRTVTSLMCATPLPLHHAATLHLS